MMRRPALVSVLAGMLVVLVVLVVPFATTDRTAPTAIPQPPPLLRPALLEVPPGVSACARPITIPADGRRAEVKVATFGKAAVPFTLTLAGEDYRTTVREPGRYTDNARVSLTVAPPRETLRGRACVRNDGRRRMAFYAADDRTRRAQSTLVGARRSNANFELAFFARNGSVVDRWPEIAGQTATFRPGGPWLVWLLGALVLVAVPVALVTAVARAARDEEGAVTATRHPGPGAAGRSADRPDA